MSSHTRWLELIRTCGVTYRQADYWRMCGALGVRLGGRNGVTNGSEQGSGVPVDLTHQEARRFVALAGLVQAGIPFRHAATLLPDQLPERGVIHLIPSSQPVQISLRLEWLPGWPKPREQAA
jgi:hypothetical protein